MTRVAVNGIHLNVEEWGTGEPLLMLHGFTGSSKTWRTCDLLAQQFRLVAVDSLGHGESDAPDDPQRYVVQQTVDDLLALTDMLGFERFDVLGYSMGGRVALHLALGGGKRVRSLILESASPGIADEEERSARRESDARLARLITEQGVEDFVNCWERNPLFESQQQLDPRVRSELRAQRLRNKPTGLVNSLLGAGTGSQLSLEGRLGELVPPALLLAGKRDTKYSESARAMANAMPNARVTIVPDCGHAVHLERNRLFQNHVLRFLGEVAGRSMEFEPTGRSMH